ncbi:PE-PPE domain-containing protein [Rhodococcus sp. SMB37]|uniref:cutinase family protein n=1 Tax=Rhodococcus sp. SMB37 TaxID=2512213 RepID=UPI0006D00861|nr:PE-PPE domain-containing protein [Rhodococcus sp. SMB37]TCN47295.1 PE-PPE domain-containing protein [Rhodococcus sp. SMB37]
MPRTTRTHTRLFCMLAAGLITTAGAVLVTAPTAAADDTSPCPDRYVLAVDGTKGFSTPDSIDPDSPLAEISDRHRGPGTVVEHIRYPAVVVPMPSTGSHDDGDGLDDDGAIAYDRSKQIGHERLRETIAARHSTCPDTDLLILGYSQGASIAGDVLAEIAEDGSVPPARISGILYSDPRDTRGVETLFPGPIVPGVTLGGARSEFGEIPVQRVCIEGDAVCDGRTPGDGDDWLEANVAGYLELHTKYPDYQP